MLRNSDTGSSTNTLTNAMHRLREERPVSTAMRASPTVLLRRGREADL
jgi:hypothetical protein